MVGYSPALISFANIDNPSILAPKVSLNQKNKFFHRILFISHSVWKTKKLNPYRRD